MSPTRIAHIVEATEGGVARHVLDLVSHLDQEEFPCSLYLSLERTGSPRHAFRTLAQERGIRLRELSLVRAPNGAAVQQLSHWLRRDGISIAHMHSAKAGYLGRQAALRESIPAIYTPHAFPFQRTTDWRCPLYRMIERRLAQQTARMLCVSEGEYAAAVRAGLPEEKLVVIPNGIDTDSWTPTTALQRERSRAALRLRPEDLVIGAIARLTPQKGLDLLVTAAESLLPDFPRATLLIWGDGPQRPALMRLIRRLHIARVQLLGATDAPRAAFAAMDIFCAPSRWEAGPYAVLEAMASGLPTVASAVPGHVDYLEQEVSGLLVPPDLPGPLDGALRILLTDQDRRSVMGEAARARVETHFTLQRMVEATATLYRQVRAQDDAALQRFIDA